MLRKEQRPSRVRDGLNRRQALGIMAGGTLALQSTAALSDVVFSRPIVIYVGFAAGGIADTIARLTADALSQQIKHPVIVENKPGASGTIAASVVARSPANGTALFLPSNSHTISPSLMTLTFDPIADFAPIREIAESPMVLVVKSESPYKTVQDVIEAGHRPQGATYGAAVGTVMHVVTELIASKVQTNWRVIPYKGSAPTLIDLMGGQIDFVLDFVQSTAPHIKAGRLRPLVVLSKERMPELPDVPTMAEATLPGFEAAGWYGLLAPAKTPPEIIDYLNAKVTAGLANPEVQGRIKSVGVRLVNSSPTEFQQLLKSEVVKWHDVIEAKGIKIN
jgi:tripartite-type tricarboxylate transporter receptor subunit TctC